MRAYVVTMALIVGAAPPCWAWKHRYPTRDSEPAIALRSDGDVIVARCAAAEDGSVRSLVARLSGQTGVHRWQVELARSPFCSAIPDLLLTPDGDVVTASGFFAKNDGWRRLVRLSGGDGRRLWMQDAPGGGRVQLALRADGSLVAINNAGQTVSALDATTGATVWEAVLDVVPTSVHADTEGDLLVTAAETGPRRTISDFIVLKLDGTSGVERWRYSRSGTAIGGAGPNDDISGDAATHVATDAAGDVIAVGYLMNQTPPPVTEWDFQPMVVKLASDTGTEIWRRLVLPPTLGESRPTAAALTPDGDVVVAINGVNDVVKLSGSSGDELWRGSWPADDPLGEETIESNYVRTLVVDPDGDLLALGRLDDRVTVGKFDGSTGERLWLRSFLRVVAPEHNDTTYPVGLALGTGGELVFGGVAIRDIGVPDTIRLSVVAFGAALAGERLVIRDDGTRRTLRVVLRDPLIQPVLPDGPGDPALEGASVRVTTAGDGELGLPLPASGWTALPAGGFRYAGTGDGCTTVVLKPGLLRARCTWQDDALALTQPLESVVVQFNTGETPGFVQCATFGGTVVADRSVAAGKPGRFEATDAPRPAGCD